MRLKKKITKPFLSGLFKLTNTSHGVLIDVPDLNFYHHDTIHSRVRRTVYRITRIHDERKTIRALYSVSRGTPLRTVVEPVNDFTVVSPDNSNYYITCLL